MEILKNSRQMPKEKEYMASKLYNDRVYAWLQINSQYDKESNTRWIDEKIVNFSAIAKNLDLARQTVSVRFKRLLPEYADKDGTIKQGLSLVTYNSKEKRYELAPLSREIASLIEKETLRKLMNSVNDNTINVYIYLLNRYFANKQKSFDFTIDQIKNVIGISTKSRNNNEVVTDILDVLRATGLINWTRSLEASKTTLHILWVSNQIREDAVKNLGSGC